MDREMRTDVELLLTLVDNEPTVIDYVTGRPVMVTRKCVARWTGRSIQTISDYVSGRYNIPIEFWARLLEHYHDARIADLVLMHTDYELFFHDKATPASTRDFFRRAVEESGLHHQKQVYIADLLADGRIDELDASTVQAYADAYVHHRMADAALHRAIIETFNRAMHAKEPAR